MKPRTCRCGALTIDRTLDLADVCGWERLYLQDIADALGGDLAAIAKHYRQKDDLVEAWFDRAEQAMLTRAKAADLTALTADKRLEELLVTWLAALTPHHAVTGKMLLYKLEPGHIHLQIGGLQRISRTVQWWREAARRKSLHLARITEESLLTGAYLRTSTGCAPQEGRPTCCVASCAAGHWAGCCARQSVHARTCSNRAQHEKGPHRAGLCIHCAE